MSHDVHATNDSQVEVSNGGRQNHSLLHHQGKFRCSSGRSVSEAALRFGNLCVHLSTLQKKPYASSEETFWFLEEAFQFAVRHYFWRVLYLQLASFPAVCRQLAYSSHQLMHVMCHITHCSSSDSQSSNGGHGNTKALMTSAQLSDKASATPNTGQMV